MFNAAKIMNTFHEWVELKESKVAEKKASSWGYHLILDCGGCNENVSDEKKIRAVLKDLVRVADMKAVGPPIVKFMKPGDPRLQGFSCIQLIETSSITMHLNDAPESSAYIDLFSCKEFDPEGVVEVIEKVFKPKRIKKKFLRRQA